MASTSTFSDSRSENIRVGTVVIAELELCHIERHVFAADLVEGADHASFEDRPEAFNRAAAPPKCGFSQPLNSREPGLRASRCGRCGFSIPKLKSAQGTNRMNQSDPLVAGSGNVSPILSRETPARNDPKRTHGVQAHRGRSISP